MKENVVLGFFFKTEAFIERERCRSSILKL
jgi:hypothetical protein